MASIFVESYNAYNSGQGVGRWIDCSLGFDHIMEQIDDILSLDEDGEEWFVADYEGWGGYRVDENPDIDELVKIADGIDLRGEDVFGVFARLADENGWSLDTFDDHYIGVYNDGADYAEQYFTEMGEVREDTTLIDYIDWDRVWEGELAYDVVYEDLGYKYFYVFQY